MRSNYIELKIIKDTPMEFSTGKDRRAYSGRKSSLTPLTLEQTSSFYRKHTPQKPQQAGMHPSGSRPNLSPPTRPCWPGSDSPT